MCEFTVQWRQILYSSGPAQVVAVVMVPRHLYGMTKNIYNLFWTSYPGYGGESFENEAVSRKIETLNKDLSKEWKQVKFYACCAIPVVGAGLAIKADKEIEKAEKYRL